MKAGCYSLDLYCDAENKAHEYGEFPHVFTHELGSACRKNARLAGWVIGDERDLCPKCSGKRKSTRAPK